MHVFKHNEERCHRPHRSTRLKVPYKTHLLPAGGIEEGAITLQPCQQYVDRWVTVSEQEIADGLVSLLQHHSKLVEGAAGCALAAFRQLAQAGELKGKQVVVVSCGGNIAVPVLHEILQTGVVWQQ
jgi:threonine dehydratase